MFRSKLHPGWTWKCFINKTPAEWLNKTCFFHLPHRLVELIKIQAKDARQTRHSVWGLLWLIIRFQRLWMPYSWNGWFKMYAELVYNQMWLLTCVPPEPRCEELLIKKCLMLKFISLACLPFSFHPVSCLTGLSATKTVSRASTVAESQIMCLGPSNCDTCVLLFFSPQQKSFGN